MQAPVVFVIAVALAFDFVNGFHDAANSIATVVSTRVLSPRIAVLWAAFFNFAAFLVFGDEVASTIAKDVVLQNVLSIGVVFAGLVGAILWDLITSGSGCRPARRTLWSAAWQARQSPRPASAC